MNKQPKALRLADAIDFPDVIFGIEAAAELRRLHEVNAELLKALKMISNFHPCPSVLADDAIAKAEAEGGAP